MVGTLIKTMTIKGLYIGILTDYGCYGDGQEIVVDVIWNDNDVTTETFDRDDIAFDEYEYAFYDNGKWWDISDYYYDFKRLLEGKCK